MKWTKWCTFPGLIAIAVACVWVMSGADVAAAQEGAKAALPPGFGTTPVFDEEFNGAALDTTKWDYRDLGPRGLAMQTKSAVSVANGHLTITTSSTTGPDGKLRIESGMISTEKSFLHTYGYWEARLKYHFNRGMQPSFWIQSPTYGNPVDDARKAGVEMDVFEHTSGTIDPLTYDHAMHWDGYGSAHKWKDHYAQRSDLQDGKYHTWGLAWTPAGCTFYIDGRVDWTLSAAEIPVSQAPEYVILSTEVRKNAPAGGYGKPGVSTATFDVDYVRVYPYEGKDAVK